MSDNQKPLEELMIRQEARINEAVAHARIELGQEARILEGEIVQNYYTGGAGLKRRTGRAAQGWNTQAVGKTGYKIVNDVEYADHSKPRTIVATKTKYLAIPVDKALTPAGVHRFEGPRDAEVPKLTFLPSKRGGGVLVDTKGGGVYYVLKKKVKIPARTAGLTPFVKRKGVVIFNRITQSAVRIISR